MCKFTITIQHVSMGIIRRRIEKNGSGMEWVSEEDDLRGYKRKNAPDLKKRKPDNHESVDWSFEISNRQLLDTTKTLYM